MILQNMLTAFEGLETGEPLDIPVIEAVIGAALPDALKAIIAKFDTPVSFNTEICAKCLIAPAFVPDGWLPVYMLFGRNSGRWGIKAQFEAYEGRIAAEMVPIADVIGDSLVLWSKRDDKVYFWNHDAPCPEDAPEAVTLMAHSVAEFLDSLEERITPPSDTSKVVRSRLNFL